MEPQFTRGEYWLLAAVVEHELALCELVSDELEYRFNIKGHGLTRDTLIDALHQLISGELIYAKSQVGGFISTQEQIGSALNNMESSGDTL